MQEEKLPLLSVNGLNISFESGLKTTVAVRDLSFDIFPGETLAVVGESGSGKSVTALSILGLIDAPGKVSASAITWSRPGKPKLDLQAMPGKAWQKIRGEEIAMIFQEPMTSLNPVMKCGWQVAEAMQVHLGISAKEAKKRTIALFKKVELPRPEQMFDAYPHQISGGQKQRVMIAMAISCGPGLLIADEPTTALDVTVQKRILEIIQKLQAEMNMACLFITHDLGLVKEIADRVLVMRQGEVVESGTVDQIFTQANHPYTRGLIACRPPLHHKLDRLPTVEDYLDPTVNPLVIVSDNQEIVPAEEVLIEVAGLKTWFPLPRKSLFAPVEFVKAVDDISFQLMKGESLGIVGESGSGKSTLGRTILRLLHPVAGQISYAGEDLLAKKDEELRQWRKKAQLIFQDPFSSLNPRMRIGDAILEPLNVHKIGSSASRKQRVMQLLEQVQLLPDHYRRYPHEFSGGQRQRIVIARALALEPEFIVCDEAVSALDVSVQAQVLNLLKQLQEDLGLTYLFITHDLAVVRFLCERVIVMQQGKVVEAGRVDQVLESPVSAYTRQLLEAVPG